MQTQNTSRLDEASITETSGVDAADGHPPLLLPLPPTGGLLNNAARQGRLASSIDPRHRRPNRRRWRLAPDLSVAA